MMRLFFRARRQVAPPAPATTPIVAEIRHHIDDIAADLSALANRVDLSEAMRETLARSRRSIADIERLLDQIVGGRR